MLVRLVMVAFLCFAAVHAAQRPAMEEQLRRMVSLPRTPYQLGLQFDPQSGFTLFDSFDPTRVVADALKDTTGSVRKDPIKALELARAYAYLGDTLRSQQALRQARALAESQLASANAARTVALIEILYFSGETDEVDQLLRRLLESGNLSAPTLLEMGALFQKRALDMLAQERASLRPAPFRSRALRLSYRQPDYQVRERANRALQDAAECFSRAVARDPEATDARLQRALASVSDSLIQRALERRNDDAGGVFPLVALTAQAERALAQLVLEEAATARELTVAGFVFAAADLNGPIITELAAEVRPSGCWAELSETTRARLREILTRVGRMQGAADRASAALAAECAGALQAMLFGNLARGEEALREAVDLDPQRAVAWKLLLACNEFQGDFEGLREDAIAWLKIKSTPLALVAAAKALAGLKEESGALALLQTGLRLEQANPFYNLMYAALVLRQPGGGFRARDPLSKAERGVGAGVDLGELRILQSIQQALSGNRELARGILRSLQGNPKRAAEAAALLDVIGV